MGTTHMTGKLELLSDNTLIAIHRLESKAIKLKLSRMRHSFQILAQEPIVFKICENRAWPRENGKQLAKRFPQKRFRAADLSGNEKKSIHAQVELLFVFSVHDGSHQEVLRTEACEYPMAEDKRSERL